LTEFTKYP